jgi:nitrogen fixation protein NifQ
MTLAGARSTPIDAPPFDSGLEPSTPASTTGVSMGALTGNIFTCLLKIGLVDSKESGISIEEALGLNASDIDQIVALWAPSMKSCLSERVRQEHVSFDEEEQQLFTLFQRFRRDQKQETVWLASALTRRCMSSNHLWQDLGLGTRAELGSLMQEFFPELASRNKLNMKWKKFFYRCLCEMEGFTLCAAPTCQQCNDYNACFGEESGLARISGQIEH